MKKITNLLTIVSIMFSAGGNVVFNVQDNVYPHTAVVKEVDYEENVVYCEDFNGHVWSFTETEDWMKNDVVSMIMDSMGTDEIEDDEIISIKYSGYIETMEDELFAEYLEEIASGNYTE